MYGKNHYNIVKELASNKWKKKRKKKKKERERMAIGDLKPRRIRAESHVKEAEMGMMSL